MSGAFDDFSEFAAALRAEAPLVGLDIGTKTIGPRDIGRAQTGRDALADCQ